MPQPTRNLAFRDRWLTELVEIVDESIDPDALASFPDQNTPITLVTEWSQEEYTRILSSLEVGAALAFPELRQQIYYDFLKLVNGMTCEQIIDCIENDADTALALQQTLNSMGYGTGGGTPTNPSYWTANPTILDGAQISGCSNDNLYGGIVQMVGFINARIVDFLQQAELITNAVERGSSAIAAIPIVGALPLDELVGFVDQLFEEIAEGYEAAYTEELAEEYACDLFCIVKDTCEMDFQTFADYFMGRLGEAFDSGESFTDLIVWFTTGVFSADGLVDAAFGLVCSALAYSSRVFGINISSLANTLTAAMNDPNSDWETLCEDCPPPPSVVPEVSMGSCSGLLVYAGGGTPTNTTGNTWQIAATSNPGDWRVTIIRNGGGTFELANVSAVSGSYSFYAWKLTSGSCSAGFSPPSYDSEFDQFTWTSSVPFTVQFDFSEYVP